MAAGSGIDLHYASLSEVVNLSTYQELKHLEWVSLLLSLPPLLPRAFLVYAVRLLSFFGNVMVVLVRSRQ